MIHFERFKRDIVSNDRRVPDLFRELTERYSSEGRYYHTHEHIESCLIDFDTLVRHTDHRSRVLAALYYHDVVYIPGASDNEERSAEFARAELQSIRKNYAYCNHVCDLIMATKHLDGPLDPEAQIVADVDLVSLGLDWETFQSNTLKIRQEFSHVSDEAFRVGRAEFFEQMLRRKQIYYTPAFQRYFESRARENMRRSIKELTK